MSAGMGNRMASLPAKARLPLPSALKKKEPPSLEMLSASREMGLPSVKIIARPR